MIKRSVGHVFDPCDMYKGSKLIVEVFIYKGIQDIQRRYATIIRSLHQGTGYRRSQKLYQLKMR